jgi:NADH-quinone oxidoreductase subunit J
MNMRFAAISNLILITGNMNFTLGLFYLFSFVLISSALVVVSTRNMVHSVTFLILAFLNAAALFVLLGAEFLAMLLIIVYVGAIAVLFLFVVMMLNVDRQEISGKINRHLPILILLAVVIFFEIVMIIKFSDVKFYDTKILFPTPVDIYNTKAIGNVLYTDFILPFQLSGAILFVAMIGAIVLTLKDETRFIRKQKISDQVSRNKENSLRIVKVKSGEGINI